MKATDDFRRNHSRSDLERLRTSNEDSLARKRKIAGKLALKSRAAPASTSLPPVETPRSPEVKLPEIRLYHRSDMHSPVHLVSAAEDAVMTLAHVLKARESQVILTWPDKLNRPLAITIAAMLRAQSADPGLQATIAYYPFSNRTTFGLRSFFLDEQDLAARYHKITVEMAESERGSLAYKYAYLLKGLQSAVPAVNRQPGRPSLREMISVFSPKGEKHIEQYPTSDPEFLGDISSKRLLIREASTFRKELSCVDVAPLAVFGLPETVDAINRCFRSGSRLSSRCDLIVADGTDVGFGEASAWLKGLRRLRHVAANHQAKPAIVVLTADTFIAKVAAEIIGTPPATTAVSTTPKPCRVQTFLKVIPIDFTSQSSVAPAWKPVDVTVQLKEQQLSDFRDEGVALAAELRKAGYGEAANAVMGAVTYGRAIACLPIGLDVLRKHLDAMEEVGAVSRYVAAPYRYLHISALLKRAADTADSLGDRILQFRDKVAALTERYATGSEVSELMREIVDKATRKANRTIIAFRDRVVLTAFDAWLFDQDDIDHEKAAHKILLTTSDALSSTLSAAARGAPIDTLLLVHPKTNDFRRLVMSPVLPRKLAVVGDGGSIGALHGLLSGVLPFLSGDPEKRVASVLEALDDCKSQFGDFDFEKIIAPEFSAQMTLDFTVQDASTETYSGPVVELVTDSGYLLRMLPQADCLVRKDDDIVPLRKVRASDVQREDRIFVFTQDLHDRLDSMLGPVESGTATLLQTYHQAVRDRVALLPGSKHQQAQEIIRLMKEAAVRTGETAQLGIHESANVLRWMSAGRSEQPDAPRSPKTFRHFMAALEVPELIAAQYWLNGVISTRVLAIQAGLHSHGRALEFVMNPQGFYSRYPESRPELRQLWEEMVRTASVVIDVRVVGREQVLEDMQ